MSKNAWIGMGSIAGVLLLAVTWFVSTQNGLVTLNEAVNAQWAQVENVYQRRSDLIPNLVNTVKGYAKHESETLEAVTSARAQVGKVEIRTEKDLQAFETSQARLSSALSRLMVVAEKYPDLKANTNFLDLQSQLEGTENRITVERQRFNVAVQEYNRAVQVFPTSIVAGMKGLSKRPYFEAKAGTENAPQVQF